MPRRNQGPRLKFLDKRGCYYIFWTENGRSRERSTGTADRREAEAIFATWLARYTRKHGPRDPSEVLVTDVLSDHLERLDAAGKDASREAYATIPLTDYFEGKTLTEAAASLEGYGAWRQRSPSTVRRELGVLQSAIKGAITAQTLLRSVAIERPPETPARERYLRRSEAAWLIAGALGFAPVAFDKRTRLPMLWRRVARPQYHLALFILIGLYTGRRKEAILSLRWPKVDLDRRKIDFRRDGVAETKKKRGQCAISPRLLPHLRRAKRFDFDLGHVITWGGDPVADIKTAFNNAAARVYLEDVSPHVLKHTAATWLMQKGEDVFKVSDYLATSVPTLLKHYGHHAPEHQAEIANSIGARPQNVRRIR